MRVAGVEVRSGAVAKLALLLEHAGYHDLAQRVGIAVDTNQRELRLAPRDISLALSVLPHPLNGLAQLRDALTAQRAGS